MVSGAQDSLVGQVPRSAGGLRMGAGDSDGLAALSLVGLLTPPLWPHAEALRPTAASSSVVRRMFPVMSRTPFTQTDDTVVGTCQ